MTAAVELHTSGAIRLGAWVGIVDRDCADALDPNSTTAKEIPAKSLRIWFLSPNWHRNSA